MFTGFYLIILNLFARRIQRDVSEQKRVSKMKDHIERQFFPMARMGEERGRVGSWWGNRRKRDHWGDLGVDWRIMLGWISRGGGVGMWTGLGWPRIGTGGGRL